MARWQTRQRRRRRNDRLVELVSVAHLHSSPLLFVAVAPQPIGQVEINRFRHSNTCVIRVVRQWMAGLKSFFRLWKCASLSTSIFIRFEMNHRQSVFNLYVIFIYFITKSMAFFGSATFQPAAVNHFNYVSKASII